jgi:hypothetical protein
VPADRYEAMQAINQQEIVAFQQEAMLAIQSGEFIDPAMAPQPLEANAQPVKRWYRAIVCAGVTLDNSDHEVPSADGPPIVGMRGYIDDEDNTRSGIVFDLMDIQRQLNIEQSIMVRSIQQMAKQSFWYRKGSVNPDIIKNKLGKPGQLLEHEGEIPQPVPAIPIPPQLMEVAYSRLQSMREMSGVNTEMTGQRQGSDAGVVMQMRYKQARTVLAMLFDHMRLAEKIKARMLVAYIKHYMTDERVIRVTQPDGTMKPYAISRSLKSVKYDTIMDEGNSSVNDRDAAFNVMQTMAPVLLKMDIPMPPDLIDLLPLPFRIKDSWKKLLMQNMQQKQAMQDPNQPSPMEQNYVPQQ